MAFITVRGGTITSTNPKGFTITESFTSKMTGEVFTNDYKVWTDEPVQEGAVVNVSGIFSKRTGQQGEFEVHINKPRIEAFAPKPVVDADAPF